MCALQPPLLLCCSVRPRDCCRPPGPGTTLLCSRSSVCAEQHPQQRLGATATVWPCRAGGAAGSAHLHARRKRANSVGQEKELRRRMSKVQEGPHRVRLLGLRRGRLDGRQVLEPLGDVVAVGARQVRVVRVCGDAGVAQRGHYHGALSSAGVATGGEAEASPPKHRAPRCSSALRMSVSSASASSMDISARTTSRMTRMWSLWRVRVSGSSDPVPPPPTAQADAKPLYTQVGRQLVGRARPAVLPQLLRPARGVTACGKL